MDNYLISVIGYFSIFLVVEMFCKGKDDLERICETAKEKGQEHSENKELIGEILE